MEITVAENAGFCFGVERAVSTVSKLSDDNRNGTIYTVGSLIHNQHIINELENRGVRVILPDDSDLIATSANRNNPCTLVIRTHGVSKKISDRLSALALVNPYFHVCDMTCPYVKKIHRIVSEHKNKQLVIFGDSHHPEVEGIRSYSNSEAMVISTPEQALTLDIHDSEIIVVAQTTQKTVLWQQCQENIKRICANAIIFDTICKVTEERQKEAKSLANKSDLMLVIGGRDSSNTKKLYETAKKVLDSTSPGCAIL